MQHCLLVQELLLGSESLCLLFGGGEGRLQAAGQRGLTSLALGYFASVTTTTNHNNDNNNNNNNNNNDNTTTNNSKQMCIYIYIYTDRERELLRSACVPQIYVLLLSVLFGAAELQPAQG